MVHNVKTTKEPDSDKKPAISYWAKEKCHCPVCNKDFDQEVMHQGGGRMIAGKLTDELHRNFEPSKKFGRIYPLIYDIGACPNCYSAFLWTDFKDIKDKEAADLLYSKMEERKKKVNTIFPYFDLHRQRTLFDGAAMYYLAILSYEYISKDLVPTMKRAILTLRLAWLCNEINGRCPDHNYDYISKVFYQKRSE